MLQTLGIKLCMIFPFLIFPFFSYVSEYHVPSSSPLFNSCIYHPKGSTIRVLWRLFSIILLILMVFILSGFGCTTFVVTDEASEDGSAFVGHTNDGSDQV